MMPRVGMKGAGGPVAEWTEWKSAAAAGRAGTTWSNASGTVLQTQDGDYAQFEGGGSFNTQQLRATDFGFSVPAPNTILGLEVEVAVRLPGPGNYILARWATIRPRLSNSNVGSEVGANINLTPGSSVVNYTYGGAGVLFGLTPAPSDVNDSSFGVALTFYMEAAIDVVYVQVDRVRMRVQHIAPA